MVSFLFFLVLRVAARAAFNFTIRRATKNTNNKKKNNENRTESLFIPFIHRVVCVERRYTLQTRRQTER